MTHYERCQREVRLLLNKLLRTKGCREPYGYRAVTLLETYLESPAFYPEDRKGLIADAYKVHNLPQPDNWEAWEKRISEYKDTTK